MKSDTKCFANIDALMRELLVQNESKLEINSNQTHNLMFNHFFMTTQMANLIAIYQQNNYFTRLLTWHNFHILSLNFFKIISQIICDVKESSLEKISPIYQCC